MGITHFAEAFSSEAEGGFPIGLEPVVALLDTRRGQAVRRIEAFVAEAIPVRYPGLVDGVIFFRHHPHHLVALEMHVQVRSHRIVRRHTVALGNFPRPRLEAEWLGSQRTDRTDIDDISRQLGFQRAGHIGANLEVLTPAGTTKLRQARHFITEPHAAGAVNTTGHIRRDQRPEVLVFHHPLSFIEARYVAAVAHGNVLQLTLAALIANRAVERMVDEQELHDGFLSLQGVRRLRRHLHAVHDRCSTCRHGLRCALDFHQTHATVGGDAQFLVIAETWNQDSGLVSRLDDHGATTSFERLAVDLDVE